MISKLRLSVIVMMLLVLLGFQTRVNAAVPGDNKQFCPFIQNPIGWLETDITPASPAPNVSAALIGTIEGVGGHTLAGMDWQNVDFTSFVMPNPTNEEGSQVFTWWTSKGNRNTYIQVTNASEDLPVNVHVRFLDENCNEILDFCDSYSANDTVLYNLADLVANNGSKIQAGSLKGHEGTVTITAIDSCPDDKAIRFNDLVGTVQISQTGIDNYGFNAYHRWGVCFDQKTNVDVNLITNGSFQTGKFTAWSQEQGGASGVIGTNGINPSVPVPPAQGPDSLDPNANSFMAYILSDNTKLGPAYGISGGTVSGLVRTNLGSGANDLISSGIVDTNVTVLQSSAFTPGSSPNYVPGSNTLDVLYDLAFLAPNKAQYGTCDNYVAVCVVDVTNAFTITPSASFVDCDCYNLTGNGTMTSKACRKVGTGNTAYTINPYEFQGGGSTFISGTLGTPLVIGDSYVVQVISAQKSGCDTTTKPDLRSTTGALVDNFRNIETVVHTTVCDGTLTGAFNAFLNNFNPKTFAGQFNLLGASGGGDAVLINFADSYGPPYKATAAFVNAHIGIWDDVEHNQSCGDIKACFLRLGIDQSVVISDDFVAPTIAPTIGPTITPKPTIGPTITPKPTSKSGSGGCAIASSPVQLGTTFANLFIPLVPVAFAFGVRALRKRKK